MPPVPSIRVGLADDSGLMRALVGRALESAGFEVVGRARDGVEALELVRDERPDVLALDLTMPKMGGLEVLRRMAQGEAPAIPVVVVSAFSPAEGATAVDALTAGAFDLVAKPEAGGLRSFTRELAEKVAAAAESRRGGPAARARRPLGAPTGSTPTPAPTPAASGVRAARRAVTASGRDRVVVIASSTGGPKALATLIPELPATLGAGTLLVQHMPPGFTRSLAERLDRTSRISVREAEDGDELDPGTILVAPGGFHLRVDDGGTLHNTLEPPVGGLRPRADHTIADIAKRFRDRVLLVVLTGMGRDGHDGAQLVRKHGGTILVESADTATVYGMPRAVAEAGLADAVLPLPELAAAVAEHAGSPVRSLR
ncbi:chemotaxis-specific protein-glutamate methyltransferase CheB [Patulibacter sp. SYSU D01012]|uniref:chemotaxis-specific protein-glutamate methyltransferase CheB n=1 Tax=Patulibacter sp. SYSU D01012 TaxID=2817381 RepID=UPI001B308F22